MADSATSTTNTTPGSKVNITLNDKELWSKAHEFAYSRLTDYRQSWRPNAYGVYDINVSRTATILSAYNVRARRIAATYARLYLETETYGDRNKKGRYYWMALGAFAAKTVACTMESWQLATSTSLSLTRVMHGLAKGNLWLFCDITPWHWAHSFSPKFMQDYAKTRSDSNLVEPIKQGTTAMPWSAEAVPKIGNFKVTPSVTKAFDEVRKFESLSPGHIDRPKTQLKHLLIFAEHEQKEVLQPLIYEDEDFVWWIKRQRMAWIKWMTPALELVFAAACHTSKTELKSVAPRDIVLENYKSRMHWIGKAAETFHDLMRRQPAYMEGELASIASWVDMKDPLPRMPLPPNFNGMR